MRAFLFLVVYLLTFSLSGQDEFHNIKEDDRFLISYQIVEVKKKGAMVPEIKLSIQNKTDGYINLNFELDLHYDMEFVEAAKVSDICIAPGKTKKGKASGLFYDPEYLTYMQMQSDDFNIVIEGFRIKKVDNCK
jgi:hypothetical protein